MTCPGCDRSHATLIGGFCGHCTTKISGAIGDALEGVDGVGDVVDVFKHKDGHVHVRLVDRSEPVTDGGLAECPHGCADMIKGVQGDPLEPEDPYCPKCGHIEGRGCDDGCHFDERPALPDGGREEAPAGHDTYDVVVPVQREIIHRVGIADDPDMGATQAKVLAKEEIVLDEDELLNGTGRALDAPGGYDVVIKVGRELSTTLTAAHPQEARRMAKRDVDMLPGEVVIGKPRVTRAPGDRRVE